jgi:putative ABC transport system substrate-binding protein
MQRRNFLCGLGVTAAWPLGAHAQQTPQGHRIAVFVGSFADGDTVAQQELKAFREGLEAAGWRERSNVEIEYRWGAGEVDRIATIARELGELPLDAIVIRGSPATAAMLKVSKKIPVVFVQVADPLGSGFVKSFARPATNATGFTNLEASMPSKWVALLKDLLPQLTDVTLLFHPATSVDSGRLYFPAFENAAASFGFKSHLASVNDPHDIENAIASVGRRKNAALISVPGSYLAGHRNLIIRKTAEYRVPTLYGFSYWAHQGGLISYGISSMDLFHRAAGYVDRILRGADPAELPVQTPTRFDLIINLKAAKALGIEVPPTLLARADEVIE